MYLFFKLNKFFWTELNLSSLLETTPNHLYNIYNIYLYIYVYVSMYISMYVHMYVCMKVCHGLPGSFRIWVCQRLSKYHRFARWCQKTFGLIETVKLPWVCQGLSKYCAFARAVKILWVCQGLSKSYGFASGCQTTMGTMGLSGVVKIPSGCHGLSKY